MIGFASPPLKQCSPRLTISSFFDGGRCVAVQEIDCLLCQGCRAENGPFVGSQNGQPGRNIARVVGTGFECDLEIGAQERRADFSDEFLACIGVIGEAFAEIAGATMCRRCPVTVMPISA
jgi:hypothetical protein